MATRKRLRIHVNGIVQGVGFRPFVYRIAVRKGLAGYVRNLGEAEERHKAALAALFKSLLANLTTGRVRVGGVGAKNFSPLPHGWVRVNPTDISTEEPQ